MTTTGARGRRIWAGLIIGALVAVAFALAGAGSRHLFERADDKPAPAHRQAVTLQEMQPLDAARFRVAAVQGSVECTHDGKLYLVQAGDLLSLADVLRTPPGTRAILRRGQTEIELRENVEIRLDRLAVETASFGLLRGEGNVVATVQGAREEVEITALEARSVNQGASRWVVALDGRGKVSVAVSKGAVKFAARGKEVRVAAGKESTAAEGSPPSDPESIPEELLLSVVWPELDAPQPEVRGKVQPSTRVRVNGQSTAVNAEGRFAARVPARVGTNRVEVEAEDLLGRRKAASQVLRKNAPAPTLEKAPEELWQK